MPASKGFTGLRNSVSAERFEEGDLEVATNVDIDHTGKLERRLGYTLAAALAGAHSLYASGELALLVSGPNLKRLADDYTTSDLANVTSARAMSYETVIGRTFYSNGVDTGVVEAIGNARTWGLRPPAHLGAAPIVAGGGGLAAGTYQWTLTYVRSDGQESGALFAAPFTVATDGAQVTFSELPVPRDPDVIAKRLYLTTTNGEIFYQAAEIHVLSTSLTYANDGGELTVPLETMHLQEAPAGQIVKHFRGHMLVAADGVLYYSQPYAYELFNLREYFNFEARIVLVAPLEDGLFVCTETHHYWLPGLKPDDFAQAKKAQHGAIEGTLVYTEGRNVGEGTDGIVAVWLSREGVCVASNGGGLHVLTHERLNMNVKRARGASVIINDRLITTAE
jgi:hypothetical protein